MITLISLTRHYNSIDEKNSEPVDVVADNITYYVRQKETAPYKPYTSIYFNWVVGKGAYSKMASLDVVETPEEIRALINQAQNRLGMALKG